MKQYIGTKIINAAPALKIGGKTYLKEAPLPIPEEGVTVREGYKVVYEGGYESFSPKEPFEKAYRLTDGMTFGLAIEAIKMGKKVARRGWNGKGMFLFLSEITDFNTEADLACVSHLEGDLILPSIVMKTADDRFCVGWLASQADMLAEDWEIRE